MLQRHNKNKRKRPKVVLNYLIFFCQFICNLEIYCVSLCYNHSEKHLKNFAIMKTSNRTLTANEIRNLNLSENDVLGFDFQWENGADNYYLTVNSERVVSFTNSKDRKKSFDKIKRMGFGFG